MRVKRNMRAFLSLPRAVLLSLAIAFAAATVTYSALWMYYIRWQPPAELGVNFLGYTVGDRSLHIAQVLEGSPAQRAGLRMDDRVVAINGRRLENLKAFFDLVVHGRAGDELVLTIERPGENVPREVRVTLEEANLRRAPELPLGQALANELIRSYPVLFLVVGLPVLFLRLRDRNAWLLAILFACFIAGAAIDEMEGRIGASVRGFMLGYHVILGGLLAPVFYYFFAVFPVRSPLDRRFPWLKEILVGSAAVVVVPLGLWVLLEGILQPLEELGRRLLGGATGSVTTIFEFVVGGLAMVSLVWNGIHAPTAEARRRVRVIMWGTVVGVAPILLLSLAGVYLKKRPYAFPFWIWAPSVLALFLFPLSIAYAVVKHRVLEIPVLLKRSARYVLVQRGFLFLILVLSVGVTLLFGYLFHLFVQPRVEFVVSAGIGFGVAFGLLLAWAGAQVERHVTERIDRAFFRSAYDARQLLYDLAQKTRTVASRRELAGLMEDHIREALHPVSLAVFFETRDGQLAVEREKGIEGLESLPRSLPILEELARRGRPWVLPPPEAQEAPALSLLERLQPECLVPVLGRDARLAGVVVLGPRLSEEPYSGEDLRLLSSVASQVGIALESIELAEQMADRMAAERRTAYEMSIAKQVQDKLFPQKAPPLETLDYVGKCVQARTIGGDYYDFLDLGPGRLGLVLADIAGKGMGAALLMANLQANLRSQYALALDDLPRLLQSVNRLFHDSTAPHHFATFFLGVYEDASRRLRYANCGHNPPVLLRADGRTERFATTATVLGLFQDWESTVEEVVLQPGDTLVVFSDGVTEAMSDEGEEFGDARLLENLAQHRHLSAASLLSTLVATVEKFSGREQEDDLTLLVARCH